MGCVRVWWPARQLLWTAALQNPLYTDKLLTARLAADSIEAAAKLMKNARFLPVCMQN